MKTNSSLLYVLCLVMGDFLALVLAFVGAYVLRVTLDSRPLVTPVYAHTYLEMFVVLLPFWIIIFALIGLYNTAIYEKRFPEIGRLLVGSFIGMLFVIGYSYFSRQTIFPAHLVPIYGFLLAFGLLVLFRNFARLVRRLLFGYNIGITNLLIIGDTKVAADLVESLGDSRASGYRVVGIVNSKRAPHKGSQNIPVFATFQAAVDKLGNSTIHSIVQTELYAANDRNNTILEFAQTHHIAYRFIPGNSELFVGNIEVELFRSELPVITVHQTPLVGWGSVTKRIFDLIIGTFLLIIALPLMLLVVLILKIFGGGKVFFRQTRLTRFDQQFQVYKFRTIKQEFNGLTPEVAFQKMGRPELAQAYRHNGDYLKNDPRLSVFGRFLRKTSLDELPQLINVVKGDLSLVGPRALIPEELRLYTKRHAILSVKSGLTGLAQVSGRKNISFDERRKLDVYYVQNWSFWFDLVILAKTIRVILQGS